MTIRLKIFTYIFSMILILFLVVSSAVYLIFYRSFYENEIRNIVNNQDNVTENVRFILEQVEGAATMIAANPSIAHDLESASPDYMPFGGSNQIFRISTLENTANILEIIGGIHVITSTGDIFTSSPSLDSAQIKMLNSLYSEQFQNPSEQYTGLQSLTLSTGFTLSSISYLRPVYNYRNEYSFALIVIDIDYAMLREVLTSAAINNNEWVLLVDKAGNTIFTYPYNTILDSVVKENPSLLQNNQAILEKKVFGRSMIVSSSDISTPSWSMVRLIPLNDIRNQINAIEGNVLILILFYVGIALLSSFFFAKIFTQPITHLYHKFQAVEKGDLSTRIVTTRKDEFGKLGKSFNTMVEQIELLIRVQLEVQQKKNDLEFEVLQAQINPHFLYNTLDSIKWLAAMQNANNIGELTTALINLLKYNISVKSAIVSLEDEIRSLSNYVVVQKFRYGDTFQTRFDLDPETLDCEVIHFMLQPIVENAIIHGFESIDHTGVITINAKISDDDLTISISDNGIGIDDATIEAFKNNPADTFNGIGMMNIHNRIQIHYGKNYGLLISSVENQGTTVTIRLPKRKHIKS
jgi:two-component system sensor histidine kinase YesM